MSTEPVPLSAAVAKVTAMQERAIAEGRIAEEVPEPENPPPDHWTPFAPRRFRDAHLDQLDAESRTIVAGWLEARTSNLVIRGPVGTGKTHAAFAACREIVNEHRSTIMWRPVVEALDGLRPDGDPGLLDRLASVGVLFLDDLGAEKPTDWTAERLGLVVNRRWLDQLPTIVTTNLDGDALQEMVGERVRSRLADGATVLRMAGADRRRS